MIFMLFCFGQNKGQAADLILTGHAGGGHGLEYFRDVQNTNMPFSDLTLESLLQKTRMFRQD